MDGSRDKGSLVRPRKLPTILTTPCTTRRGGECLCKLGLVTATKGRISLMSPEPLNESHWLSRGCKGGGAEVRPPSQILAALVRVHILRKAPSRRVSEGRGCA